MELILNAYWYFPKHIEALMTEMAGILRITFAIVIS